MDSDLKEEIESCLHTIKEDLYKALDSFETRLEKKYTAMGILFLMHRIKDRCDECIEKLYDLDDLISQPL